MKSFASCDLLVGTGAGSAASAVAVGSVGAAASVGLSASFVLFFPVKRLLSLDFRSESVFEAVWRCMSENERP